MHEIKEKLQLSDDALKIIREVLTKERSEETGRWHLRNVPGLDALGIEGDIPFPTLPGRHKIQKLREQLRKRLGLKFSDDGLLATIDPKADAIARVKEFVAKGRLQPGDTIRRAASADRPST